jgi:hypothetical protein
MHGRKLWLADLLSRSPSFAAEAFERLRVVRNIIGQEFEGDKTSEFEILGLVNHAHAASAQFFEDVVVRNGLADHRRKADPDDDWRNETRQHGYLCE